MYSSDEFSNSLKSGQEKHLTSAVVGVLGKAMIILLAIFISFGRVETGKAEPFDRVKQKADLPWSSAAYFGAPKAWDFFDEGWVKERWALAVQGEKDPEFDVLDWALWDQFVEANSKKDFTGAIQAFREHPDHERLQKLHDFYIAWRIWLVAADTVRPATAEVKAQRWTEWGSWNNAQCHLIQKYGKRFAREESEICTLPDWRSAADIKADEEALAAYRKKMGQ